MPATLTRPVFVEDQLLEPDDLNALINYARTQLARHARSAHTWGVVEGLQLGVDPASGNLTVAAGWAVNSAGAQLVVPSQRLVPITDFQKNLSRNENDGNYPVFLVPQSGQSTRPITDDPCGVQRGTNADETPGIQFGRLTELDDWLKETAPPLDIGPDPDPAASEAPRRVLLGFVGLTNNKFDKPVPEPIETAVRPVYVGVIAGEVRAANNLLTLRAAPPLLADSPILLVGPTKIGTDTYNLVFGTDDGTGQINNKWQLRIKSDGTIETSGGINPKNPLRAGEVRVQSGTITDGLRVPLPSGVTEADLTTGQIRVHVHLTPRPDLSGVPSDPRVLTIPQVCRVDESLRVECVFAWFTPTWPAVSTATPPLSQTTQALTYLPGVCDYSIIVIGTGN